jgi:hypothetical protein
MVRFLRFRFVQCVKISKFVDVAKETETDRACKAIPEEIKD